VLTASSAGPFFQFIDDSRRTDLQYPSRVSDATAIEAHINHLLFDLRPAPFVSRVEDEGAARAVGRLTAVALLTGFSLAAFDDVITLTAGTAHRNKDHHSLLSKESVSMAYMAVEVQIWNTTHLQIRTLPRNAVASSMKAWPSPHLMKTTVSVIFVGMWIFPVDNSSRLIETSSLSDSPTMETARKRLFCEPLDAAGNCVSGSVHGVGRVRGGDLHRVRTSLHFNAIF
jgi:hypothetical protein